jgi:hypothetical protein
MNSNFNGFLDFSPYGRGLENRKKLTVKYCKILYKNRESYMKLYEFVRFYKITFKPTLVILATTSESQV